MKALPSHLPRVGFLLLLGTILSAGNCFDPNERSPTSPAVQGALRVSLSSSSIPADGTAILSVTAEIDPRADAENRVLVFQTTDGRFLEATTGPFRAVERSVDSFGKATATLRSSRTVQPVELTVTVKAKPSVFVRTIVQFTRAEPSDTISFVDLPSTALADMTTLTPITISVDESLPSDQRNVTFTTSRGTFASTGTGTASAIAGSDHRARVDLKSPLDPGTARITATVDGVTIEAALELVPAPPETILVSPAKIVLQATNGEGGTTPVKVRLLRQRGKVSPTTVNIGLIAETSDAELPILVRDLAPTDTNGETIFTMTVGSVTYRGPALIEVRVDDASTVGRARVEIVDPPSL